MMKIVSLVPSITESLCAIGLKEHLVGCTHFCVKPKGLHKTVAMVGGTKDPNLTEISRLNPTHILVNQEENRDQDIAALQDIAPCLVTFPKSPQDVPQLWRDLGSFLGSKSAGDKKSRDLQQILESFQSQLLTKDDRESHRPRVAYFIWRDPYMVVGPNTYIDSALEMMGLQNVFSANEQTDRYPEVRLEELVERKVDWVFLSSEPYAFRKRHAEMMRRQLPNEMKFFKVDGQLFSWYGQSTHEWVSEAGKFLEGQQSSKLITPL